MKLVKQIGIVPLKFIECRLLKALVVLQENSQSTAATVLMIEAGIIQIEENSSYRTLIKLLFGRNHDGEPSRSGKQLQPSKVPTVGSVAHFTTSIYIARNYNATYDKGT